MKNKDIPIKIAKRIKYVRGKGYILLDKEGNLEEDVVFYSKVGAAMMLMGIFRSNAYA